ncbi:MAG: hypothetical protein ABIO56_02405 [Ferruginibacter sp.]
MFGNVFFALWVLLAAKGNGESYERNCLRVPANDAAYGAMQLAISGNSET